MAKTEMVFILDKSGSMAGLEDDTIGGFNSMLEKQRALPGEATVTTVLFDSVVSWLHDGRSIMSIDPMTRKDYIAGGCTALLDAVGTTIATVHRRQKNMKELIKKIPRIFLLMMLSILKMKKPINMLWI